MTQPDPVLASLERLAEHAGDVTQELYRGFRNRCPESAALMGHMDDHMLGRMMEDVLMLLMTPPADIDRHYLSFEVSSHRAYGVSTSMFPPLLEVVRETVRQQLGSQWTAEVADAWSARLDAINLEIDSVGRAAG